MASVIKASRRTWKLGPRIGDPSGFAHVHEAVADDGTIGVVKLVPKEPGADRELLFEELSGVPNIVPIIDTGETADRWVLVMPRAERSLRGHLVHAGGALPLDGTVAILIDIARALAYLDGRVVHRDVKPENVLLLNGSWCLADFGIARYAEASTAQDTRKFAMSPPYAAPERWRFETAKSAADVYAVGVMAWEMLMGHWPFPGPGWDDFREQHLHADPPDLTGVPAAFVSLVDECLYKPAESRPTPRNLLARLERALAPASSGAARLQEANRTVVAAQAKAHAAASAAATEAERRQALFDVASSSLQAISARLRQTALDNASGAARDPASKAEDWALRLGPASIGMDRAKPVKGGTFGRWKPAFDVVASAGVGITIPAGLAGYEGRSHSLWFGDLKEAGVYRWYEIGFMVSVLIPRRLPHVPAALEPGENAGKAFGRGINEWSLARRVVPIDQGEEDAFIERWLDWFGQAAAGTLHSPSHLPEDGDPSGSYRAG